MKYVLIFITLMVTLGFTIPTHKYAETKNPMPKDTITYHKLARRIK